MRRFKLLIFSFLLSLLILTQVRTKYENNFYYDYPAFDKKLQHYKDHRDEYDLLIIGGSTVYRQISPVIIDKYFAQNGLLIKSFNFGVPLLSAHEISLVLDEIEKLKPLKLKYVIIEPVFNNKITYKLAANSRVMRDHTLLNTLYYISTLINETDLTFNSRIQFMGLHLISFVYNLFNIGFVSNIVQLVDHSTLNNDDGVLGHDSDGFRTIDDDLTESRQNRNVNFKLNKSDFINRIEEFSHKQNYKLFSSEKKKLQELNFKLQKLHAKNIFILGPKFEEKFKAIANIENSSSLADHIIDLSDPAKYPELFLFEERWDLLHFNKIGAQKYSLLVAQKLLPYLSNFD